MGECVGSKCVHTQCAHGPLFDGDVVHQAVTEADPARIGEQRAQSSQGYSYDAVGNRTQMVNGAAVTGYSYGAASNRLAQVTGGQGGTPTMDANGSTTGNGISAFNYDARGRMVSANTAIGLVSYRINALGQRVQKVAPGASTVFHYDSGGRLIAESTGQAVTDYVYLDDIPVAVVR